MARMAWSVMLAALAAAALAGAPAQASGLDRTIDPGFDDCPAGEASCPAKVILEMYERWRPLNASCDRRAVFALTYLRTTEEFSRAVVKPGFFEDVPWIVHEDAIFAQFYFRAFDGTLPGGVPVAWQIAFDGAASPDLTALGDMLLGMNAHINRDLAYTLAAVGLEKPGGGSRKADHDKVNDFLTLVALPLGAELGRRYDPLLAPASFPPADGIALLQTMFGWRENAWQRAVELVEAEDDPARAAVAEAIEADSEDAAQQARAEHTQLGYGAARDAYCRRNLEPSFTVAIPDRRLRRVVRRGRLRVAVRTDGPARITLRSRVLRGPALARPRRFERAAAGTHRLTLKLTRRARRALRKRRRARVRVTLEAPGLRTARVRALRRR